VYNRNSNRVRIIDEKERDFNVYFTEIKEIKKLADYLIGQRFSYAIVFSDDDIEPFAPYFKFIRAGHQICLIKNHIGLKTFRPNCMIEFNLGQDEGNYQEKIRYYFKNVLGIAV
jgi:hypothetical protein